MTTTPFFAASALLATLAIATPGANAAELDRIVMDPPVVQVVGHDSIDAPVENVTVVARVIPDPETLTTASGVKLLNDYILDAARRACFAADPTEPDDGTCVRNAVKNAKQQIPALVAHAKSMPVNNTAVG
jgi:UrcA family protein